LKVLKLLLTTLLLPMALPTQLLKKLLLSKSTRLFA
jgi:hypothetical protein